MCVDIQTIKISIIINRLLSFFGGTGVLPTLLKNLQYFYPESANLRS